MRAFETDSGGVRIVFGAGTISAVAAEVDRLGGRRALVLATPGHASLADRVAHELGPAAAGVFAGAVMHTPLDVTEAAVERARTVGADSLVSIGGGSTTGLGKAIAARTGLPHLVLPTTYAGSEVTPVLGETAGDEKRTRSGPEILPAAVIYDVDLTLTLPWTITVTSAVNAMAHAVEALYGAGRTPDSDRHAADALASLSAGLHALDRQPDDADARADLLFGAWLAGTCLGAVGMGLHHKLCHTLGGTFGLPHAPTHAVVLPHAMAYNENAAPEALAAATTALGVDNAADLQSLIAGWGGPTSLAQLGFAAGDIPRAAELAAALPYPNPREVTAAGVAGLLGRATSGAPPGADG